MDFPKLKSFLVCCEELNYTRAGERLYITRQGLRQTILALEAELGVTLFSNFHNHLSLTAEGKLLRAHAHSILKSYDNLLADIKALQHTTLRIGISCSLLPFCTPELPLYLEQFEKESPPTQLELVSVSSDEIIEQLQTGEIDAGIATMLETQIPHIATSTICRIPLGITFSQTHRFASISQIFLNDLDGEQCLVWGSPRQFLRPLCDALDTAGIKAEMEIVTSAKRAFYLMETENRIMIEYTYPNTKHLKVELNTPLKDAPFQWQMVLMQQAGHTTLAIAQLMDFLIQKYNSLQSIM